MIRQFFSQIRYDLPAAVVVFLVAVPLCLGIALASGAPLFSGLIAGMIGGIVISLFSNSSLGVSGPAAGLIAVVLMGIETLGSFEVFLLAVFVSGLFQILLGFLKAGSIGYYFPTSVIKGMLAGIGLIIILKQIPHALGDDIVPEGLFAFVQKNGLNTFSEIASAIGSISPGALIISMVALAILILWNQPFMKAQKWSTILSGALVAVISGVILNLAFQGTSLELRTDQIVALPVAADFSSFVNQFTLPDFSAIGNMQVYVIGLTLAAVASVESLLCAEATDKLDPQKRITDLNRELKAQGIGNLISGLIGGLPITQVIIRSSANIQSGGKTRASAFMHGVLLLVCVALIPTLLNLIPLASLAAVLIMVGYRLARPALFKEMFSLGWTQGLPFLATIVGILFTDLLTGIGIGIVVALFFVLRNNFRVSYFLHREKIDGTDEERIRVVLPEDVTFLNKGSITGMLRNLPENTNVLIDATESLHIDYDVVDILRDFQTAAEYKNINLEIRYLGEEILEKKPKKPALAEIKEFNHRFHHVKGDFDRGQDDLPDILPNGNMRKGSKNGSNDKEHTTVT